MKPSTKPTYAELSRAVMAWNRRMMHDRADHLFETPAERRRCPSCSLKRLAARLERAKKKGKANVRTR